MKKNYKKGEVLVVEYRVASSKQLITGVGIVLKKPDSNLILVHNFSATGRQPIDITKIPLKNIVKSKSITPKEINSLSDL